MHIVNASSMTLVDTLVTNYPSQEYSETIAVLCATLMYINIYTLPAPKYSYTSKTCSTWTWLDI